MGNIIVLKKYLIVSFEELNYIYNIHFIATWMSPCECSLLFNSEISDAEFNKMKSVEGWQWAQSFFEFSCGSLKSLQSAENPKMYWFLYTAPLINSLWWYNRVPWKILISSPENENQPNNQIILNISWTLALFSSYIQKYRRKYPLKDSDMGTLFSSFTQKYPRKYPLKDPDSTMRVTVATVMLDTCWMHWPMSWRYCPCAVHSPRPQSPCFD